MPVERKVTTTYYLKLRLRDENTLKSLKEDAERIIASNAEETKLFSENMEKLAKQILKDIENLKMGNV